MAIDFSGKPGEYTYSENEYGKSAEGIVAMGAQSSRNAYAQRTAGGQDRQAHDDGGHLIAHSMGGKNTPENLDAQSRDVNRTGMRSIERNVSQLARDSNNTVYYSVQNHNAPGSMRPDSTMITAAVHNNTTGQEDVVHISMQNASYAEQESWNQTIDALDPDTPRDDPTLTPEENALAHEYAEYSDLDVPLGEASYMSFDNSNADSGLNGMDADSGFDGGMDADGGMDGGFDGGME